MTALCQQVFIFYWKVVMLVYFLLRFKLLTATTYCHCKLPTITVP